MTYENPTAKEPPSLWVGQRLHFFSLFILLIFVSIAWIILGKPLPLLFWLAIVVPIVHQIYVWLAWRWQLATSAVSRTLGFRGYLVIFFTLFASRFVTIGLLAWFDRDSLPLSASIQAVGAVVLALPAFYALYSTLRYFGMARAAGADHFQDRYRHLPLVNRGIFRFSRNGMYLYGFLLFWAIAIAFGSASALVAVAFSHLYIWIHYYTTEKLDMDYLYAPS